ncbi:hypothetical protein [Sphingomonas desiccabilis]|uniref:Uncharacterized protein n=1 Tax=Sphingomonas desiccabilis TaxID=429134 RepID=A0A4Q2IWK1_9SPHN|nr:hypothetical protein [Sphingomonas desiccabilis]MBB3910131.1 hypothetical protein [Sphingomonas desiccabilis]RXZ34816.1 hypothetical protein EO081_03925 [Sphingomonas desiccabilis]
MSATRIRFPTMWANGAGGEACGIADFKLGKGPCGLTVSRLDYEVADGCLHILQQHADGPPKRFVYPLTTITGRIEADLP